MVRPLASFALAVLLVACGTRVLVPARVDLGAYPRIGLVGFSSNSTGSLAQHASQRFVESVQEARAGTTLLELGSEAEVLREIGRTRLDFEAARAIGAKWGVDAVFTGQLDVAPVAPRVRLASGNEALSVQAEVRASLHVKLLEARSGATAWTRSGSATRSVAHVRVANRGPIDFDAGDPERAYGDLVGALVSQLTGDFTPRWERR